jgi:hypothetical protein
VRERFIAVFIKNGINQIKMENSLDFIFGDVKKDLEDIYTNVQDQVEETLLANYSNLTRRDIEEMPEEEKRALMGWD